MKAICFVFIGFDDNSEKFSFWLEDFLFVYELNMYIIVYMYRVVRLKCLIYCGAIRNEGLRKYCNQNSLTKNNFESLNWPGIEL